MSERAHTFGKEFLRTTKLALPITIGLVGQGLLYLTDTAMAGYVGNSTADHDTAQAASAFGGVFSMLPFVFGLGLAVAVPVLTAQSRGAGKPENGSAALRHGVFITFLFGIVVASILHLSINFLNYFGQDPAVVATAKPYTIFMTWSIVPALMFQCFKNFREAILQPWVSLFWLIIGIITNVALNWVFMFGNLGAPEMGLAGAGLATLLARVVMLVGIALTPGGQPVRWRDGISRFWLRASLKLGVPSAFQWGFEATIFAVAPILIGLFGKEQQAAHQIVYSMASFAFMVPLGISQGASIRVGEAFGAKNRESIKKIAGGAMLFSVLFMTCYVIWSMSARHWIPSIFRPDSVGTETASLAADFIIVAAAFALFDAIQVVASGALRGINDVLFTSIAAFTCYWIIAMPVGCFLGFTMNMKGLGVWLGLAIGIFAAAVTLGTRLIYKSTHLKFQAIPSTH
ncbi:MAG: MATE family efflux transporter [Puniceicoccales bacterium]|jgi:MATE family multidrug resistance protein|nr:MATE family efflux transporter [Puniceicoccales bacterium]